YHEASTELLCSLLLLAVLHHKVDLILLAILLVFIMILHQPSSTLFPYTTLFRSSASSSDTGRSRAPCAARRSHRRRPGRTSRTRDRKSTRLNSSHVAISYAVFCLKKKNRPPHGNFR